jgi:hypothetical protein
MKLKKKNKADEKELAEVLGETINVYLIFTCMQIKLYTHSIVTSEPHLMGALLIERWFISS